MKWYLSLVVLVLVGVFIYQVQLMKKLEPSSESLGRAFPVNGTMHYKYLGKMGDEPQLDGRPMYCSANFLGGKSECRSLVSSLNEGASVTASVVAMPTRAGVIWLAMELRTPAGDYYHASPEDVVREWRRQSHRALWQTPLLLFAALGIIPWAMSLKFKK